MDTNNEEHKVYGFGWWPEIFGAIGVAALVWYLMAFARGSI
ncbi:hypothetical protein [Stappia stellulata]|nr:hypothetical protein [Stappia stellulata]